MKSRIAVTEESWLVHLVNSIEFDTAIVPRGAVTLDATRHTVINNAFSGMLLIAHQLAECSVSLRSLIVGKFPRELRWRFRGFAP